MNDIYATPTAPVASDEGNTSGLGKGHPIPPGVKGWSWGAFLLNLIWSIGNRTWIGLLVLVPVVGFVMNILLGVKGREWAWQNKRWESVEHFNRVQKNWSIAGLVILGGYVLFFVWAVVASSL